MTSAATIGKLQRVLIYRTIAANVKAPDVIDPSSLTLETTHSQTDGHQHASHQHQSSSFVKIKSALSLLVCRERMRQVSGFNMAVRFLHIAALSLVYGSWRSTDAFVVVPGTPRSLTGGSTARGLVTPATNRVSPNGWRSSNVFATLLSQQVDDDRIALSGEEPPEAADENVLAGAGAEAAADDAVTAAAGTRRQPRAKQRQRNTMFVGNLSFGA